MQILRTIAAVKSSPAPTQRCYDLAGDKVLSVDVRSRLTLMALF